MLVPALVAVVVLIAVILAVRWIRHKSKNRHIVRYRLALYHFKEQ